MPKATQPVWATSPRSVLQAPGRAEMVLVVVEAHAGGRLLGRAHRHQQLELQRLLDLAHRHHLAAAAEERIAGHVDAVAAGPAGRRCLVARSIQRSAEFLDLLAACRCGHIRACGTTGSGRARSTARGGSSRRRRRKSARRRARAPRSPPADRPGSRRPGPARDRQADSAVGPVARRPRCARRRRGCRVSSPPRQLTQPSRLRKAFQVAVSLDLARLITGGKRNTSASGRGSARSAPPGLDHALVYGRCGHRRRRCRSAAAAPRRWSRASGPACGSLNATFMFTPLGMVVVVVVIVGAFSRAAMPACCSTATPPRRWRGCGRC